MTESGAARHPEMVLTAEDRRGLYRAPLFRRPFQALMLAGGRIVARPRG